MAGAAPCGQRRNAKLHAPAARSTCSSQNAENTPGSDHFFEVTMSKNGMPLWCEAHLQVKK